MNCLCKWVLVFTFLVMVSPGSTISILAARALANADDSTITVQGTVTSTPGTFMDNGNSENGAGFTIQDDSGGLMIYVELLSFYDDTTLIADLVLGRVVTVSGPVDTNTGPIANNDEGGGTVRVKPSTPSAIVVGDLGDEVEALVIKPDEVKDHQGKLVQIHDVNITTLHFQNKWGADYRAEDADGKFTSIMVYPPWDNYEHPIIGQVYESITGIASVFEKLDDSSAIVEEEFELWPRTDEDLVKLASSAMRVLYSQCIIIIMALHWII